MISMLTNPLYINLVLLILGGIFILKNKRLRNGRKIFVALATIQWIIISGFRHITIGEDTLSYSVIYERTFGHSFSYYILDIKSYFADDVFWSWAWLLFVSKNNTGNITRVSVSSNYHSCFFHYNTRHLDLQKLKGSIDKFCDIFYVVLLFFLHLLDIDRQLQLR